MIQNKSIIQDKSMIQSTSTTQNKTVVQSISETQSKSKIESTPMSQQKSAMQSISAVENTSAVESMPAVKRTPSKELVAQRFSKAVATYTEESYVQQKIAKKMIRLLKEYTTTDHARIIELGCGTGFYSQLLLEHLQPDHLWLNDLCQPMLDSCRRLTNSHSMSSRSERSHSMGNDSENDDSANDNSIKNDSINDDSTSSCLTSHCLPSLRLMNPTNQKISFLPGDAEKIPFPEQLHLITSCSTLQWFDSVQQFFARCQEVLKEEGYLAFSTFGEKNMTEIRQLTGRGLSYHTKEELEHWLANDYTLIYSSEESISMRFHSPMDVLYHLKQTGVTGLHQNANHSWTRKDLSNFCARYYDLFGDEKDPKSDPKSVLLTYHPIYIIAKKKEKEKKKEST
ncbi:MAG: malonyl-ACP O-methyltransferase [Bacteroides sp.]